MPWMIGPSGQRLSKDVGFGIPSRGLCWLYLGCIWVVQLLSRSQGYIGFVCIHIYTYIYIYMYLDLYIIIIIYWGYIHWVVYRVLHADKDIQVRMEA